MIKCIHFISVDCIGGVQCAARSCLAEESSCEVDIRLLYLSGCVSFQNNSFQNNGKILAFKINSPDNIYANINNPIAHLWAFFTLIQQKPDVLVCSLWRSMPVGIVYKLFFPKVKFVCFLHSALPLHIVDKFLNHVAMYMADAIWADSKMTLTARVPKYFQSWKPLRVISFILEKVIPKKLPANAPIFVFWGRLDYMKGIDRSLRFFATTYKARPDACFYLYGPDGNVAQDIQTLAKDLGVPGNVHFMGLTNFDEIKSMASNYSYYLQLSRKEGMAMSVVEAMQLGLVPIVTPVGEIVNYCQDHINAVIVEDIDVAANRLLALLDDAIKYHELQKNAVNRWVSPLLYRDDFSTAVKEIYRENIRIH
ncbi:glycosyltransferase family 4 protein [Desulfococcaceae bacterium HSG7]|nr:glycosyltransferase family 4 protein [Desulfococcaceae bacterium HSG7]